MSLPVIAILVASLSACFTAANMLVSAATYRRGGPRLKLTVDYSSRHGDLDPSDETTWRGYLHVHVQNRSAAVVEVERVYLRPVMPPLAATFMGRRAYFMQLWRFTGLGIVTLLEGEDKRTIPAFGGARWVLNEGFTVMARPDKWMARLLAFRVEAMLTNGLEAHSRPMLYLTTKRYNGGVHQDMTRLNEAVRGRRLPATLDDALRELEGEAE
ncbi:hypothetical protein J8N05_35095 [Streptomyces sp. BH-SS-21]|uniref:Uncharacterized protein n=1 Tax=Streptomyces liliiviolaceus TaxID=2823109 RepID=A0A940Y6G1_9ACTN|nr:hypothetical protein [Streptomyces liliiviolaceus]MBQ0853395.1 hypothetical protein [Streptomyces liliiviolaceus]